MLAPPAPARRADAGALTAAVLGPLALYAATLPRTVVLEDDGLFLMAGVNLGVAHPPGYPIHTLIVHLFTRLPFGDPAVLGHLSSAVLGALACGAVYASARLLRASLLPALTAAWLFGVSEQFWSQAIITEVYTFNALLFFAAYALVLLGARDPGRGWPLWCAAVAWGAGLANHWPLMVLATPGLALVLLPAWRTVLPRLPRLLAVALASAALPYAWMVWLSHQSPAISFYGPIETWGDFWFYVSREGYSGVDISPSASWGDRAGFLGWFAADLVRQTTLPGMVLAVLGLGALGARRRTRNGSTGPRPGFGAAASGPRPAAGASVAGSGVLTGIAAAGSGALALLGNSVVLIVLLGFDFDPFWLAVFRPYPLVCYGVAALWVAAGMQWAIDRLRRWTAARWVAATGRSALAVLAALTGTAMVALSASAGWPANDRSGSDLAQRHAEVVFDLMPSGATLFVFGDDTGSLGYHRYVEQRRPDVTMYNLQGLVFENRLFDPLASTEEKQCALDRFVAATEGPVFLLPDADLHPTGRGLGHHGFLLEVLGEGTAGTVDLTFDERGQRHFVELLDRRPVDRWEAARRNGFLTHYGKYLGLVVFAGSPLFLEPMAGLFERADDCYPCLLGMAGSLLDNDATAHADRLAGWLARAETLRDQALSKQESAKVFFEQGRLAELTGAAGVAAARYRQAYAVFSHPDIDAGAALRRLGLVP
ncbi:MAG: DUF2723 domain-containing protein [bacterium]|nr:DUF2723 domain-containing protein [bacterium]